MRVAIIGLAMVLPSLGGVATRAQTTATTSQQSAAETGGMSNKPVILRQSSFNIPFSVKAGEKTPREVRLFVSRDRGRNWRLYDRADPAAEQFPFRAEGDGEYWFSLQTIEADGRATPGGTVMQPGLRLLIDTVEPQLEFHAAVGSGGEVTTSWRVFDPTLAPETLKIEYQTTVGGPWKAIALQRQSNGTPQSAVGQLTWWPDTSSRVIHVRAEVSDKAANKAVVNRRVFLPRIAARRPAATRDVATQIPADPFNQVPQPNEGVTWAPPAAEQSAAPAPTARLPQTESDPPQAQPASEPQGVAWPESASASTGNPFHPAVRSNADPPVAQPVAAGEEVALPSRDASPYGLPRGIQPRMTNSARFELDYDVDSVGPNGIADVELWATEDGGASWKLWHSDDDRQSPLVVDVPREGIYGFRVVVVGNNGLSGRKPVNGDLADLWVGVDTTQPSVRLTSAIYGEGRFAGQLDIRWEAKDAWFPARPVTLLFSEHADGPWSTIASGIPNTGQYFWPVEARIPEKIYLRIEVRDEAGNVGAYQVTEPVNTSGLVPQAHIRGLRPAAAAAKWRFFQ
jgi:hypothetical protein